MLREFAGKVLICLAIPRGQTTVAWGKSTKFPVSTGKTGNFGPTGETGYGAAFRQPRRSAFFGADRPLACQPQHNRTGGRGAALRGRRVEWDRTQSRRPAN
jgi:hypothetical protein